MTPYLKQGEKTFYLTIPRGDGTYFRTSSGTRDRETAIAMEAMVELIGPRGQRMHWLTDAILSKRLKVSVVFDHYMAGTLLSLEAMLNDVDVSAGVAAWVDRVSKEHAPETVRKYVQQIERIFPRDIEQWQGKRTRRGAWQPVMRSTLTGPWLKEQLAAVQGSNTNRRRHGTAWTLVLEDLKEQGILRANPMRELTLPPSNKSKTPHISMDEAEQLVARMPAGPHRALAALRHGAGVEMQAALATRRRDIVDEIERIIWAHGEKNTSRDRQVIVEPWAWTILMAYVKSAKLMPNALLFPVRHREHGKMHDAAVAALLVQGITVPKGYTLHAACHTFCVDGMKRGRDAVLLANNRGHSSTAMVNKLYGKFRPTMVDIIRADRRTARGG
jgi:site-specific recombinase XerD